MAKGLGKRLVETALGSRSAPYRWLRKNHAEIAAVFATQVRPSWKALAITASQSGETFTADTLRKAWLRLEQDLTLERERAAKTPVKSTPHPVAVKADPSIEPDQSRSPVDDDDDDDPDKFFRPVSKPQR